MALSGTKMVEVGTTNRTHLRDYEAAITEECAMLLKIHPSNYRVTGFHSAVPREELASLAHSRGLIFMEDLGSGMLIDLSAAGLSSENDPTVAQSLKAGCDLVTFSGDKLLGGRHKLAVNLVLQHGVHILPDDVLYGIVHAATGKVLVDT